jgi:hypothetical protein
VFSSAEPSPLWGPGKVFGGRYRLLGRIGAGAMGEVWRAEHLTLGTHVAIKLVDASAHGNTQEALARFVHEARAAARLRSPNVVQILDHGTEGRLAYIAMELLEGVSLRERLGERKRLHPAEVAAILMGVARAMGRAHELGILHRDLKPENVFLARTEAGEMAKVVDFGIAKIASAPPDAHLQTQTGMMVGTPAYMSPEQILGTINVDFHSDLWQLGVIAYECLTGARPFDGRTMGELFMRICSDTPRPPSQLAEVPAGFDGWFARACRKNPMERFGSAAELATTLHAILMPGVAMDVSARLPASLGETAPGTWEARPQPAPGARRGLTAVALVAVPLLVGGALAVAMYAGGPAPAAVPSVASSPALPSAAPRSSASASAPLSASAAPAAAPSAAPAKAPGAPLPGPSAAPAPSAPDAGPAAPVKPRSAEDQAAEVLGI